MHARMVDAINSHTSVFKHDNMENSISLGKQALQMFYGEWTNIKETSLLNIKDAQNVCWYLTLYIMGWFTRKIHSSPLSFSFLFKSNQNVLLLQ